ncbi:hypothetical protein MNBD_ALPHA09-1615 [hydrothermal vent metagenome]|uniref:Inner membrane protein YqjF n=1 Tax=hydrothermal vent metagenome TaxID=652676 RepID=A0A3B0U2R1_9ZZZZ
MAELQKLAAPLGRLLIAAIFVVSGLGKITAYAGTQGYMEAVGVPGALLPAVIGVEVLAGLAVIVGWQTRAAALALAGFSVVTALVFHFDLGNQAQFIQFSKNFAIAGGFLFLVAFGPGAYAIDNRAGAKPAAG